MASTAITVMVALLCTWAWLNWTMRRRVRKSPMLSKDCSTWNMESGTWVSCTELARYARHVDL